MFRIFLCNVKSKSTSRRTCIVQFRNFLLMIIVVLIVLLYKIKINHEVAVLSNIPASAQKFIFAPTVSNSKLIDRRYIKKMIDKYNSEESILNIDIYGPVKKSTIVMVILVGKYSSSLKYFLSSLSQLKGVENVLIIFSHSYFDENINTLIKSVDFCRVLQIFYPYSVQLYPDQFPGYHKGDCSKGMDIKSAHAINCTGAFHPDIHGHYRDPHLSEIKLHWWWTANKVFEDLTCTVSYRGIVVFLEHDYLFIEDFLYMVLNMKKIMDTLPQCEFMSLGANSDLPVQVGNTYGIEVTNWEPTEYSNVLAFDYTVWNIIVSHYDLYCYIDENSWSRSLYYISLNRKEGKSFKVIYSLMPRAFKLAAGSYDTVHRLEIIENIYKFMDLGKRIKNELAPAYFEVSYDINLLNEEYLVFDYGEDSGGWNDPRDRLMCANITIRKIKKVILEMKNEFKDYIHES